MKRRNYIKATGAAATGLTIAGCLGGGNGNGGDGGGDNGDDTGDGGGDNGGDSGDGSGGDDYPSQPITVIIPYGAGGGTDSSFRAIQGPIEDAFPDSGEGMVINNVSGGGGQQGTAQAANADPDGYTLLVTPNDPLLSSFFQEAPYDPQEFLPISYILDQYFALVSTPDRFSTDFDGFVEDLQSETITVGTVGTTGSNPYCGIAALDAFDADFDLVPYNSGSEVSAAAASGDVDLGVAAAGGIQGMVEDDRVVMHFLSAPEEIYDGVPIPDTVDYDVPVIPFALGAYAPPETPEDRVSTMEEIFRTGIESDEAQQAMEDAGYAPREGTAEALDEEVLSRLDQDAETLEGLLEKHDINY